MHQVVGRFDERGDLSLAEHGRKCPVEAFTCARFEAGAMATLVELEFKWLRSIRQAGVYGSQYSVPGCEDASTFGL